MNPITTPDHRASAIPLTQIIVDSPATFSQVSTDVYLNTTTTLIPNDVWNARVQDKGRPYNELGSKTYKRNKIISIGPEDQHLFFFDLTAIAVDFSKIMRSMQELEEGWKKLPKSTSQIKEKIVSTIMALRSQCDDGSFKLSQESFVTTMQNFWGTSAVDLTPHPNDRLRLFGIIMTIPRMRPYFQRLCDGITNLAQLDSPSLSIPQIFADIRLAFNNEDIIINLPDASNDLENIELLDANDASRISIDRNRKYFIYIYVINYCHTLNSHILIYYISPTNRFVG